MDEIKITAAVPEDAASIANLLQPYAARKILLGRTAEDILEYIQNFLVARILSDGSLAGSIALRDFGGGLQEIRSLAVAQEWQGKGIGSQLIMSSLELARQRQARQVFALTLHPELFRHQGFAICEKECFPQKVWTDCRKCPKYDACDEVAVSLNLA